MKMNEQRQKQMELISQLKSQLSDLETYAYEVCILQYWFTFVYQVLCSQTGDADLPTCQVIEKQSVIIDQLKNKLDLRDVEHLEKLT
jgi:hypothetical protein